MTVTRDKKTNNVIADKSYAFALNVIQLAKMLRKQQEHEIASQLLRCGTSIGANIQEAQCGVSRADFAAKMGIASKEARESHYWLRLVQDSGAPPTNNVLPRLREAEELIRILTAIVKTSQKSRTPKFNIQH
ncbi:MAG: four helix bundle protein [Nitrospira sp.]|nr:four helix bundle protein [Nitrospira sp.]